MATNTISSTDLDRYLSGAGYPCDKQALLNFAKSKNAPKGVIDALNGLPNKQFASTDEIAEEMDMDM